MIRPSRFVNRSSRSKYDITTLIHSSMIICLMHSVRLIFSARIKNPEVLS